MADMKVTSDELGILIENPDPNIIGVIALRGRLSIEVRTGLKFSNRGPSTLDLAKRYGYTGPRNKAKALAWAEALVEENAAKFAAKQA